jgi:sugar-specific transcriptional regulator TrmB
MATITIADDVYARIESKAAKLSTTVDQYLETILKDATADNTPQVLTGEARKKVLQEIDDFIKSQADAYPSGFQVDDSRDSIYNEQMDHVRGIKS